MRRRDEGKLPHSQANERYVLGACLCHEEAIAEAARLLRPSDFYFAGHQVLFGEILALWQGGSPVDGVTVAERLRARGLVEEVGGYAGLGELMEAGRVGGKVEYCAMGIRDDSISRRVWLAASDVQGRVGTCSGEEVLGDATARLLEIASGAVSDAVPLGGCINETFDRIDARAQKGELASGIATGFMDLDRVTAGLHNGELVIVAARPSVGKSGMGLNLARNMVRRQNPVLFVSLEMSRLELAERLLCCEARVNGHLVRTGKLSGSMIEGLGDAGKLMRQWPLYMDDAPQQTLLHITAVARRLKHRQNIRAVFVDYLQLVAPANRRDPRHEQVAAVSRGLKLLARDLNIPVVAMAQLNRGAEQREGRPRLSDLRESGSIENDADTVMLLHRPKGDEPGASGNVLEVIVAKQRNGPTGTVTLTYLRDCQRVEDHAEIPDYAT